MPSVKNGKLTEKQKQFCREYLIDFNATRAAIRAGYAKPGASVEGSRLLANVKVQEFLEKEKTKVLEKGELTVQYVVDGLRSIADDEDQVASARVSALSFLGKYLGMVTERGSGESGITINIVTQDWSKLDVSEEDLKTLTVQPIPVLPAASIDEEKEQE